MNHIEAYREIERRTSAWAATRPDLQGVLAVGSRAWIDRPADEYSDLDLTLFADDPDALIDSEDWLHEVGPMMLSFVEQTAVGGWRERRAVFRPMLDVDFSVVPSALLDLDFTIPGPVTNLIRPVIDRGFRIVYDPRNRLAILNDIPASAQPDWIPPDEASFRNLVVDFWYHAMWATKKLMRGELLVARQCLDGSMKDKLRHVVDWLARVDHPGIDPWHGYRFFEERTDSAIVEALHATYGGVSRDRIRRDLAGSMDLFGQLARSAASRLAYAYPDQAETHVRGWIREAVPDTLG
ncbi:MAG: aminoglycoside 6-adenylyltransferase [Chloroflexota bacterium]|nr:aminoglycoside 6-adenylyltransferase [Chloroflexota bacterium]